MRASHVSRRSFVKVAGLAAAAGPLILTRRAHAQRARRFVIANWGGEIAAAQRKVFYEPFAKEHNLELVEATSPEPAKLKAMVDRGVMEWDLVSHGGARFYQAYEAGYLESLDYSKIKNSHMYPESAHSHGQAHTAWAGVLAFNTRRLAEGKRPQSWADFWDVKRFPGPRALRNAPQETLEFALMADGVPPAKLYPLDLDRAFKKMAEIKPHVTAWWSAGSQHVQLLADEEVWMSSAWNGRIVAAQRKGSAQDVGFVWNQGTLGLNWFCVPKGAPNKALAMEFISASLRPERLVQFAKLMDYGPLSAPAMDLLSPAEAKNMPTHPEYREKMYVENLEYWGKHLIPVTERYRAFIAG